MEGETPLAAPVKDGPINGLWRFVVALVNRQNRSWTVKPDGFGKFIGSDEKVVLQLSQLHQFIVIENGAPFFYNIPAALVGAVKA